MLQQSLKIAFFDSGVGGLSVLQEVLKELPMCEVVYVADSEKFPYGLLSEKELLERVNSLTSKVFENFKFDICVVACNTASTVVLPTLRANLSVPIVGVVPAIKPASNLSRSGTIGLLATPGTIRRTYTDKLIQDYAQDKQVIRIGSSKLVEIAERKLRDGIVDTDSIKQELTAFIQSSQLDIVVLACTHFPLLEDELKNVLGPKIIIISSGPAIAKRVASLAAEKNLLQSLEKNKILFLETNPHTNSDKIKIYLSRFGDVEIAHLDMTF